MGLGHTLTYEERKKRKKTLREFDPDSWQCAGRSGSCGWREVGRVSSIRGDKGGC